INENKLFARLEYLKGREDIDPIPMHFISAGEEKFTKRFGVSSEELMKIYPLNENVIENVIKEYNAQNSDKQIYLTEDEQNALTK
ncbi:MAG: hypothetical protein J5689_01510, partial [Clostridia bacterium]|nr:hypothetical protein [Clostridia bacterium]